MATKWIKSLHCKSSAVNDVVSILPRSSSSCKNSFQSLRDIVVESSSKHKKSKPPPPRAAAPPPFRRKPISPAMTELPAGHPSRNVVEIIFHTSWGGHKGFPGRIEMVFKVQNLSRTVTRFEEYREMVKSRAKVTAAVDGGDENGRCVADGNEVMRFYCLGAAAGGYELSWGGKEGGTVVCTYSGSGAAHENAGGGWGRRAMLVSRVISGRTFKKPESDSVIYDQRTGFDSVVGEDGELLVFDSRALLPCFVIIYKL